MRETQKEQLEARLGNIPAGQVSVRIFQPETSGAGPFAAKTQTITQGKGFREVYPLFPGAELSINAFLGPGAAFRHQADPAVLEIDYCRSGRVGWAMRDGLSVYLGRGDLSVHGADWCAGPWSCCGKPTPPSPKSRPGWATRARESLPGPSRRSPGACPPNTAAAAGEE